MTYPQQQPQYAPPTQFTQPGQFPGQQYGQPMPQQGAPTGQFFQQDQNAQMPQQSQPGQFPGQQYGQPIPQQGAPVGPPQTDTAGFFGSGAAWVSWDTAKGYQIGSWYGGQVISKRETAQTDYDSGQIRMSKYRAGEPLKQLVIEVQTSMRSDPQDDGRRNIAIKSGLTKAARLAFEAAGDNDIQIGGWFYCSKTGQEMVPIPGTNRTARRNNFQAIYAKPGSPDPAPQPAAGDTMRPQPLNPSMVNGVPQPGASATEFAAYAAQQAAMQGQQPGQFPGQQFAQPQQVPVYATDGPAAQQYYGQQPSGPIANAPAAAMANFAQQAQQDPAVQAAIYGQPPQNAGQVNGSTPGAPQSPAVATPQGGQQPPPWTPYSPS